MSIGGVKREYFDVLADRDLGPVISYEGRMLNARALPDAAGAELHKLWITLGRSIGLTAALGARSQVPHGPGHERNPPTQGAAGPHRVLDAVLTDARPCSYL